MNVSLGIQHCSLIWFYVDFFFLRHGRWGKLVWNPPKTAHQSWHDPDLINSSHKVPANVIFVSLICSHPYTTLNFFLYIILRNWKAQNVLKTFRFSSSSFFYQLGFFLHKWMSFSAFFSLAQQYLLQENMKKDDKKSEALILKWLFFLSFTLVLLHAFTSQHSASLVCGSFLSHFLAT